jgi:hypothetical protein
VGQQHLPGSHARRLQEPQRDDRRAAQSGARDQDDAGLIETARTGVRNTLGIDQDPDVTHEKRWDRGIPS